jgi:CRP-like cAMP-binding protein
VSLVRRSSLTTRSMSEEHTTPRLQPQGSEHNIDKYPLRPEYGKQGRKLQRMMSQATNDEAVYGLRNSTMFSELSETNLRILSSHMRRVDLKKGQVLMQQDDPQRELFIITRGTIMRMRFDDRQHETETLGRAESAMTVGALHLLREEPSFATVVCSSDVTAFALSSETLRELLSKSPSMSQEVIYALCKEVRSQRVMLRTSLLQQKAPEGQVDMPIQTIMHTSLAASIEVSEEPPTRPRHAAPSLGHPVPHESLRLHAGGRNS